jgi:hypothetical protein
MPLGREGGRVVSLAGLAGPASFKRPNRIDGLRLLRVPGFAVMFLAILAQAIAAFA